MTTLELEREAGAVLPERETLSHLAFVFINQEAVAVNVSEFSFLTFQSASASNFAAVG